jgi:ElaB/YqjD/DUF883 family membrane-anchored ribosome-binding protein
VDHQSPELIERQMGETRESLTEKVALLEQQVVGTIQSATDAVQETVQSVRSAVEGTVATVSGSVKSSVECMTETLDVRKQTQNHPWAMMGCSAMAGFVTGMLVFRRNGSAVASQSPVPAFTPRTEVVHRRPQWLEDIFELAGGEVKKLATQAVMTASATIKQAVSERLPQMLDRAAAQCSQERNRTPQEQYPQPAI